MTQELARVQPQQPAAMTMLSLTPDRWQMYKEVAAHAFKSGFFKGTNSQEACITVMLQGIELGMQPMAALNNIYIVNGRPSLKAQLMAAIIVNAGHPPVETVESTDKVARIRFRRKGSQATVDVSFTWEQAQKAKLTGKDVWQNYPEDMLWNRAVARGARRVFPELFAGLYTPDELQTPGEIIEAEAVEVGPAQPLTTVAGAAPAATKQQQDNRPPRAQAIADRHNLGQDGQPRKPLTQADFEYWLAELKTDAKEMAQRLSDGQVSSVREWVLAHPAPDKDLFRHVLRAYVEWGQRTKPAYWNWSWDSATGLPIAAQDIPFSEQPVTHQVADSSEQQADPWESLTGDEFADWIGVMTGRDPRTDEKLKAEILEPTGHATLTDWWKEVRKTDKQDPYRIMLKKAVETVGGDKWVWDSETALPVPGGDAQDSENEFDQLTKEIPL